MHARGCVRSKEGRQADALRQLLLDPRVIFAGYKVPHPLDHMFVIKLQTKDVAPPLGCTPIEALRTACEGIIATLGKIRESFQEDFIRAKAFADIPATNVGAAAAIETGVRPTTTFGGAQTPYGAGQSIGYVPAAANQRDVAGGRTPAAGFGMSNPYDM